MIRHQIVDEEDLKADFEEYAEKVRELKGVTNETKLEFYGLYKQATCGACTGSKPGYFDFRGQAKYDAWSSLGDLSQSDAMLMYIDLYNSLDEDDLNNNEDEEGTVKMSTLFDPKADEAESESDIWHACRHGHVDKVKELITPEVLREVDTEGRGLLHWAIDRNHLELAQWLLSQGCATDIRDAEGSTALHYAVTCEYVPLVTLLLEHGATLDIKDEDGDTPLDVCDSDQIRELLMKYST